MPAISPAGQPQCRHARRPAELDRSAQDHRRSCNGNKSTSVTSKEANRREVMRDPLGASLNIRHKLSSREGAKQLQLILLPNYIPRTSAFTLGFSASQGLRTT